MHKSRRRPGDAAHIVPLLQKGLWNSWLAERQ